MASKSNRIALRWVETFSYLRRFGIKPEAMVADSYDNRGYTSFILLPDGKRLTGPGYAPVTEYNEWPEGFEWAEFVARIQDDTREWERLDANKA
jgi:hypothetical protein